LREPTVTEVENIEEETAEDATVQMKERMTAPTKAKKKLSLQMKERMKPFLSSPGKLFGT
jgi:hypothetical protein